MFKKLVLVAAVAAFSPLVAQSQTFVAPDCALWNPTSNNMFAAGTGYVGCVGSLAGNLQGDDWNIFLSNSLAWHTTVGGSTSGKYALDYLNKSDDPGGNGIFTSSQNGLLIGTLTFDVAQTGLFGLGLKAGNQFSVYLFNGGSGSGILSINFNTIGSGIGGGNDPSTNALSHAAFLDGSDSPNLQCVQGLCTTSVVPEPSTYALMASGLLGIFGFARRRRTNV